MSDSNKNVHVSNVSNAVVNTGSVAGDVTNNISLSGMPGDDKNKAELVTLFKQLEAEIRKLPSNKREDAQILLKRLSLIVEGLEDRKPDKEVVQFGLDSLKKAAENVAAVMPTIIQITLDIVKKVQIAL